MTSQSQTRKKDLKFHQQVLRELKTQMKEIVELSKESNANSTQSIPIEHAIKDAEEVVRFLEKKSRQMKANMHDQIKRLDSPTKVRDIIKDSTKAHVSRKKKKEKKKTTKKTKKNSRRATTNTEFTKEQLITKNIPDIREEDQGLSSDRVYSNLVGFKFIEDGYDDEWVSSAS